MKTALYPARIHRDKKDNIFYVQFLDLENGFAFGETLEKAKEMAADVLSALLLRWARAARSQGGDRQNHEDHMAGVPEDRASAQ